MIKDLKKGMSLFGNSIAALINSILLTLVYFIGIGASSLASKVQKKKYLQLQLEDKESYWEDLDLKTEHIDNYYKRF